MDSQAVKNIKEMGVNFIPGLILGSLVALLIGFIFHFWKGGGILRMLFILLLSVIGFAIGHLIGKSTSIQFLKTGWLNMGFGVVGAILFSFIAIWLSNIKFDKSDK